MSKFLARLPALVTVASKALLTAIHRQITDVLDAIARIARTIASRVWRGLRGLWSFYVSIETQIAKALAEVLLTILAARFLLLLVVFGGVLAWYKQWLYLTVYLAILAVAVFRHFRFDRDEVNREIESSSYVRAAFLRVLRYGLRLGATVFSLYLSGPWLLLWLGQNTPKFLPRYSTATTRLVSEAGRTDDRLHEERNASVAEGSAISATEKTYGLADPFEYCQAVTNTDYQEENRHENYTGPRVPTEVSKALQSENVAWRCVNGEVFGCVVGASGRACLKRNTSTAATSEMREYCQQWPESDFVPMALIGNSFATWRCRGSSPVIDETETLDEFGYSTTAWRRITKMRELPRTRGNAGASDSLPKHAFEADFNVSKPVPPSKLVTEMSAKAITPARGGTVPATLDRYPPQPVLDGEPLAQQEFRLLTITLLSLDVLSNGDLRAKIEFRNNDDGSPLKIAHRAEHSDGIADFWKSSPKPLGNILDDGGNRYKLAGDSLLGFARNEQDWLVLDPESSTSVFLVFKPDSQLHDTGLHLTLSMDLRVYARTGLLNVASWTRIRLVDVPFHK